MAALLVFRVSAVLALSATLALIVAVVQTESELYGNPGLPLASRRSRNAQQVQSLLGFSPELEGSTLSSFEDDDDEKASLPGWATNWAQDNSDDADCTTADAEQCNPVGKLGLWVMHKTEPKYNPSKIDEEAKIKKCMELPGWALHECLKMREMEFKMRKAVSPKTANT